jgi:hypothetical protein
VRRRRSDDQQLHPKLDRTIAPDLGPLFDFPTAPPAIDEQRQLALDGTIEAKYLAWRATPEGQEAYQWIATRATELVAGGATRLSISQLVEGYRFAMRQSVNNTFRAPMVRELEDQYPVLAGLFEQRVRRTA